MIESSEQKRRLRRNLALLLIPALISAMAVYLLWQSHPDLDYWLGLLEMGRQYLVEHPWALVAILATLPGLGFPISPVLILFGVVLVPLYGIPITLTLAIAAQAVCTMWSYALAAGPLRGLLTKYILRKRELPSLSDSHGLRLGLIVRLTPGIPYAIQNIVLGIMGMRFRSYLLVSIPATSIWTVGFVITGGAIFKGQLGWAIIAVIILIMLGLVTRRWSRKNSENVG
jgi:uncharacterized membrane protein YdjX (TVP38/TMEM64 family)